MWNILGIEPTKDIKAIKAAYAKLAKQYNPEEHPEEFKRIFDAYKSACAYARSKNTPEPQKPDTTQEGLNLSFAPKQEPSQSQENAFDFSNVNENAKPKPQMEDKKEDNALDFSSVDEAPKPDTDDEDIDGFDFSSLDPEKLNQTDEERMETMRKFYLEKIRRMVMKKSTADNYQL